MDVEMIVVTGAAGFIGSNVVKALNAQGVFDIGICDWFGNDGRWMNLRKAVFTTHILPERLPDFIKERRPEAVIHLGANSSTTASDGDEILKLNVNYTMNLVHLCAEFNIPIVYASSAATYGDGGRGYIDSWAFSKLRELEPLNLYGWSKSHVDTLLAWMHENNKPLPPKCIGLKFFNVYGPNEFHKADMMSVVGKNYTAVLNGKGVKLFKSHREGFEDGGQLRDFVYVDDVVKVILWMLQRGPKFGIFNCGSGKASTFREFVEALFVALEIAPNIEYIPMPDHLRNRYQYFTEASLENLRLAGYEDDFLDVKQGVNCYVEYLNKEAPLR